MKREKLKSGIYRHYKGNFYEVFFLAQHSETEELMVVYKALYGKKGIWVRPYSMFIEKVEVHGIMKERFSYIKNNNMERSSDASD